MSKRILIFVVPILAVGLIAAGCGGDDDETTSSTTSTTTGASGATGATGAGGDSDVVAQVNALCKSTDKDINAAFRDNLGSGEPSPDELDAAAKAVAPVINDALDQMRAVDGAEDDEGVSAFIDAAQSDVDKLESDPTSLGPDSFAAADKAAEEAGLTDCVD